MIMYLGADLTGVDLRSQDVSFLVGLGTQFEGALLTEQQRRQLRSGREHERQQTNRKKMRDVRLEMIARFIEQNANADISPYSDQDRTPVPHDFEAPISFEDTLRSVLLDPFLKSTSINPDNQFGSDYMSVALHRLSGHLSEVSMPFFGKLFQLFGDIQCPVDGAVINTLTLQYKAEAGSRLGELIARMRPTRDLDTWWILDKGGFQSMIATAAELSRHRKVHPAAIESFVNSVTDASIVLKMLTEAEYDLQNDQAERIAYAIIDKKWPSVMVPDLLNARVPKPLQAAFFRQLLGQADSARVMQVVRWLDQDRGAVGALSLENAIRSIQDFAALYRLGKTLQPNLRGGQLDVLRHRLLQLAVNAEEVAQAKRLR
ncbi:hypothetical protein ACNR9W_017800 (plasmid) [Paracoccus sp. T5]